jgi:hypothetical protein
VISKTSKQAEEKWNPAVFPTSVRRGKGPITASTLCRRVFCAFSNYQLAATRYFSRRAEGKLAEVLPVLFNPNMLDFHPPAFTILD